MNTKEIAEKYTELLRDKLITMPISEPDRPLFVKMFTDAITEALSPVQSDMPKPTAGEKDCPRCDEFPCVCKSDIHEEIERCLAECKKKKDHPLISQTGYNELVEQIGLLEHLQSFPVQQKLLPTMDAEQFFEKFCVDMGISPSDTEISKNTVVKMLKAVFQSFPVQQGEFTEAQVFEIICDYLEMDDSTKGVFSRWLTEYRQQKGVEDERQRSKKQCFVALC